MTIGTVRVDHDSGDSNSYSITPTTPAVVGDTIVLHIQNNDPIAPTQNDSWDLVYVNDPAPNESAYETILIKTATASEPVTYSGPLNQVDRWHATLHIIPSTTPLVIDLTPAHHWQAVKSGNMICGAANGRTVAANSISIIVGNKDRQDTAVSAYTTADNSYTGVAGSGFGQMMAAAHRIYTAQTLIDYDVTIGNETRSDNTFSSHLSLVEPGAAINLTASQNEIGDTQSASLQTVAQIAVSQTELGDSQSGNLSVFDAPVTISASQTEIGDTQSVSLQAITQISASQPETGDTQSCSILVTSAPANLAVSQIEAGDSQAIDFDTVAQISTVQFEAGDNQAASFEVIGGLSANQTETGDSQNPRVLQADYSEAFFTVPYASLHADSSFTAPTYSIIVAGDSFTHVTLTPEDGHIVSMSGDGVVSLSPSTLSQNQTVDFGIYDVSDGTIGNRGTLTIYPAAAGSISANQTELAETQSATLEALIQLQSNQVELGDIQTSAVAGVLNSTLSVNQVEQGDVTSAALNAVAELAANQAEIVDTQAASFVDGTTVTINANQTEAVEIQTATLEALIQFQASQDELGDDQSGAFVHAGTVNIAANQAEADESQSAGLNALINLSADQVEAGDVALSSLVESLLPVSQIKSITVRMPSAVSLRIKE